MEKQRNNPAKREGVVANGGGTKAEEDLLHDLLDGGMLMHSTSRRDFLKVFGFSFASAAILAGCKRPVQNALTYIKQPPEIVPGKSLYYASSFYDGHEYSAILVKTRDGRPIKIEGNSLSLFNQEGSTARVQASVLSLYDDARLKYPAADNQRIAWDTLDEQVNSRLAGINSDGGEIVLLTSSIISPSTTKLINEFGAGFRNFRWIQYDAVSYSAILEANSLCFGQEVIPDYHFDKASVVLSVNADFLGTWLSPVHFIPGYVSGRKLDNGEMTMLRHIQYESGMSLTGANADVRKKIKPSDEKIFLIDLYNRIAEKVNAEKFPGPSFSEDLSELADDLVAVKGKSIVVSGTNNRDIQIIVNGINTLLDNYAECIDLKNHLKIAAGIDNTMEKLVEDLNDGKVKALLMYNVNPVYDYYGSDRFQSGIKKTDLTINMAVSANETVGTAKYECPVNHYLESWDDAEIIPGQLSLCQPCINPLFDTRSFQDSLLKWAGKPVTYHDYIVSNWEKTFFPHSGLHVFRTFWEQSLGNGIFTYNVPGRNILPLNIEPLRRAVNDYKTKEAAGFEVVISESVAVGTGMHANNPWLMELPDPVSRQCWENVAAFSPSDAGLLGIKAGDMIRFSDSLILPAFIQPGQAEKTVSVALGYGHTNAGPVCAGRGVNLYPFAGIIDGNRVYGFEVDNFENTLKNNQLALTQEHSSMEGRPIVRETLFSRYKENPSSGNELHRKFEEHHQTLYPDVKYDGFHWGLAVDLNSCIGCNSCVIACQAENNIPVVGKEEVIRRRIMHWIKIDRYYSEESDNPKVYFQPLTCQHCDNAPCENVCPVSATNHSSEGLNQMSYNRCVGTKYCINNCPYKVRRFNWYRYTNNKEFDFNTVSELGKMVLNPDVTVRERGVVEKCSFCVQRIQEKKLQAKLENRTLEDYEIKTACMQACPSGAIVFGNLNDKNSKVSRLFKDPRCYQLLEELHTLPSIGYLTRVRNDEKSNL